MAEQFCFEATSQCGYVEVMAAGLAAPNQVLKFYREAFELAKQQDTKSILLDVRHLRINHQAVDVLNVVSVLQNELKGYKVARVIDSNNQSNGLVDKMTEIETLKLKSFDSESSALTWLL